MRSANVPRLFLAAAWALACVPALGQRVEIPTPLPNSGMPPPAIVGSAPMASLEGTIQTNPSPWDPYASPGTASPSLLSQDPYLQSGTFAGAGATFTSMRRMVDDLRVEYLWMPGTADSEMGITDLDLSVTFAIPFLYNTETPLRVTSGFAFHWWNGPAGAGVDLPARVYDSYLEASWNPRVTEWLSGELSASVGVYSDFKKVTSDSIRYPSTGLMVLTFSPSFKIKAGVMYLDRYPVTILPAGGVIWKPNPDIRFELLFPNPKITKRLTTYGNTEWWGYLRGEYGGGAWTVSRLDPALGLDLVGYNDLRAAAGVEFIRLGGLTGLFETGVAFERNLRYKSLSPEKFYPNTTVFLRAGLAY